MPMLVSRGLTSLARRIYALRSISYTVRSLYRVDQPSKVNVCYARYSATGPYSSSICEAL